MNIAIQTEATKAVVKEINLPHSVEENDEGADLTYSWQTEPVTIMIAGSGPVFEQLEELINLLPGREIDKVLSAVQYGMRRISDLEEKNKIAAEQEE